MLGWLDIAIVGAYIAYSVWSGLGSRHMAGRDLEEYFLAGRSLKGWHAGISMAATQFAADTPLVVTGLIATSGIFSLWRLWIYALAFMLMALVQDDATRLLLQAGIVTTAAVAGDRAKADRRRLFHNLTAAFGSAFSIFCLLAGLGSWMVGSPAPAWLDNRVWWIGLNLAVGLGGLPLWFWLARLGRLEPEPA